MILLSLLLLLIEILKTYFGSGSVLEILNDFFRNHHEVNRILFLLQMRKWGLVRLLS